jgi:succinoglycan biosynthesis protein ExoA
MSEPELKNPLSKAEPRPDEDQVDATVLIPIFNEERHIAETIASLGSQRIAGTLEFLLIDGRSTDGTRRLIQELTADDPRFIVLDNLRRVTPHALNLGLRAARGRYIVRMDAHTHYPVDYISRGIARLEQGDVAWVSGPQMPYGVGDWSRRSALALNTWLGRGGAKFRVLSTHEVEVDTGFSGIWRRETLERYGGWDEDWPINQDSEMAARFRLAGDRIVCLPEMGARYIPRDSLPGMARQYWRYGIYRAKTSRRHAHTMRRSHVLAPGVAIASIGSVIAPRPLRKVARGGLVVYLLTIFGASARVAVRGDRRDAAFLPAVFATMHLSWGFGFLVGCARFGIPLRALTTIIRRKPSGETIGGDCPATTSDAAAGQAVNQPSH